jgi:hypothetical protein
MQSCTVTGENKMTPASLALFSRLCAESHNWNGTPLVDCNPAERGNLTDLKKAGLVRTERADGCDWVVFTDAGLAEAASRGLSVYSE